MTRRLRRSPNAPRDPAAVRALRAVAEKLLGRPASAAEGRRLLKEALAPACAAPQGEDRGACP